jgi:hypothetical protein
VIPSHLVTVQIDVDITCFAKFAEVDAGRRTMSPEDTKHNSSERCHVSGGMCMETLGEQGTNATDLL